MQKAAAIRLGIAAAALAAIGGCRSQDVSYTAPPRLTPPPEKPFAANTEAGVPVATAPPQTWAQLVTAKTVTPRTDPFQLHPIEQAYEVKQNNMRVFGISGQFFPPMFTPTVNTLEIPVLEPQPYRRLAGILVGETVLAIIDMGDGKPMRLIRPGDRITGTPWTVASIDEEKAVLRRSGRTLPHEVIVRLETPPAFAPQPNFGGGGNGGGGGGQPQEEGGGPSKAGAAP